MMKLFAGLVLAALIPAAQAGIVEGDRSSMPSKGIMVPNGKLPTRLECWVDGYRQVLEARPAHVLPAFPGPSTRLLIRQPGGVTTMVVVPGAGASGCLPLR